MKIVSNTGPIIGLAKIDRLFLLKKIASEVMIPPMVHRELLGKFGMESERIDRALNEFLRVTNLNPLEPSVEMAISGLGNGERQAIGLASSFKEDILLLIDDRAGREVARQLNIPTIGLVGFLFIAKKKGILENIGALIDDLRIQGYWLSDEVVEVIKRLSGEK